MSAGTVTMRAVVGGTARLTLMSEDDWAVDDATTGDVLGAVWRDGRVWAFDGYDTDTGYRTRDAAVAALVRAARTVTADDDPDGEVAGATARRIAGEYASSGTVGRVLAEFATTGRARADALLTDIRASRPCEPWSPPGEPTDLDRLATYVLAAGRAA